jgi:hypothetical protein
MAARARSNSLARHTCDHQHLTPGLSVAPASHDKYSVTVKSQNCVFAPKIIVDPQMRSPQKLKG